MGSSDTDESAKEPKTPPPPSTQDQATSTAAVNAERPGFQAYSHIPPPGFMASHPQPHPYMWGVQQMVPPYGAPPHPYMAMYPHGGMYAHPSIPPGSYHFSPFPMPSQNGMAEASGNTNGNTEADSKPPEGKEKLPIKRSRGSLGKLSMITGKSDEECKTTGLSANGASSKSAESASDGSSEGSDANSQHGSPTKSGAREGEPEVDAPHNGSSAHTTQNGGPNNGPHTVVSHAMPYMAITAPGARAPATNLNLGMDYWGVPVSSAVPAVQGKVPSTPSGAAGLVPAGSRDNLQSHLWLQDEKELKRQRRKQSNRESARRSRLRKQAECDELAQRAEVLKDENANLRAELSRIRSQSEQLKAENTTLKKKLGEIPEDSGASRTEKVAVSDTQDSGKTNQVQIGL